MSLQEWKVKMSEVIAHLTSELSKVRTGRATPDMLDSISIDVYGTKMPIKHIANVSVPDARTIVIQPWDTSNIESVEKAIISSDLGLSPVVDGNIIRLSIPQLTQEIREGLVKDIKEKVEQSKVSLRGIRHKMLDALESSKSEGGVSEDDIKRERNSVEKEVRKVTDELDEILKAKEKELMTI